MRIVFIALTTFSSCRPIARETKKLALKSSRLIHRASISRYKQGNKFQPTRLIHHASISRYKQSNKLPVFYTRKGRTTSGNIHPQSSTAVIHCLLIATHFTDPRKDDSLCQARECHRELNPGRWRQKRVCYHTVTCSLKDSLLLP